MDKIVNFIKKYCYISLPIITIFIYTIIYFLKQKYNLFSNINISKDEATLIQISGTLIGFLLTAMTIFLSLPKDTELMKRIKKHKHHIIFGRCVFLGLLIATLNIILWIFSINETFLIMLFILSLEETLVAAYYIYKLCIYNFQ